MNTNTLRKCIEELKKESPKIDYILGMLETIIELGGQSTIVPITLTPDNRPLNIIPSISGSGIIETNDIENTYPSNSYATTIGPIGKLQ